MSNETNKETQTWWRVGAYFDLGKIIAREIHRDTAQFVFFMAEGWKGPEERREGKDTEHYKWLKNEADAVRHARYLLTNRCDGLRARLEFAEAELAAFNEAHPLPATKEQ
jgi:hypothetical protein